jgi:hypothetical protein
MGRIYDSISIVTIREIVENGARLEIPIGIAAVAKRKNTLSGALPLPTNQAS